MITVIGAGLGGLTLAAVLHRGGIEVAVYDLDASATSRHQGGMLDIHEDSGQAAVRAAGVYDGFRDAYLEGADGLRVLDKSGAVLWSDEGGGDRPEIDRGALRDLLLSALPAGMVRWGARMTGVRAVPRGHEVTFADGSTVTTELLVGADGAWSLVRPLLSCAEPAYAGISFVEARIRDSARRHPGDVEAALTAYESAMFPRAEAAAAASMSNLQQCFAQRGAQTLAAMFQSFQAASA